MAGADDLLDQWLSINEDLPESKGPKSTKSTTSQHYPVSANQQQLWLIQEKHPDSPVYNYCEVWRFKNKSFDLERFASSFKSLINHHAALRSNFDLIKEELLFSVIEEPNIQTTHAESRMLPEEARHWIKKNASSSFDLSNDLLCRIYIVDTDDQSTLVGLVFHHIVVDAWSMNLIRADFAKFYQGSSATTSNVSYQDFTQTEYHEPDDSKQTSSALEGPVVDLPTDFLRPSEPTYLGNTLKFHIDNALVGPIRKLLEEYQTTSFHLFLAVFKVLLYKYTGKSDISLGVPYLNRDDEDYRSVVGYFVDARILRSILSPTTTFSRLLGEIKDAVVNAIDNSQQSSDSVSIDQVDGAIERDFQIMFVFHSQLENEFQNAGLPIDIEIIDLDVSKFDLTLHLYQHKDGYEIGLEYSTDLFEEGTIKQLYTHFENLFSAVVKNPEAVIDDLSVISKDESEFLINGLNKSYKSERDGGFVVDEILHQMESHPKSVAVVCGDKSITYEELDKRSREVAEQLQELEVDISGPISIYMSRSIEYVISIVGILRFGGYYLPLDPEYPDDRILQYINESGSRFILSTSKDIKSELVDRETKVLLLDKIKPTQDATAQASRVRDNSSYAYIIFTSGSSNKPKGVPVSNANLHSSNSTRKTFYSEPVSSFLLVSSFSFDSSVAGIFWTLTSGGKLVVSRKEDQLDAKKLARLVSSEKVSHTLMLPSLYNALIETNELHRDSSLKVVIVAGEECPRELVNSHFSYIPNTSLYNEYGPTEGTVWCVAHKIENLSSRNRVPIGQPIANTVAYVLDDKQDLTPRGLLGELFIGGDGLVSGYSATEDNEGKFFDNPFHKEVGTIYSTGDLVRIQNNGLLEFYGRVDNQVKVRGYRIELEEIENAALELNGVNAAKAVVSDVMGNDNLSIVLVFTGRNSVKIETVKNHLSQKIPRFMIPDHVLKVLEIPRLPNGKVDLSAVKDLISLENESAIFKMPSTYLEKQVAIIWADVLGLEEVPVDKDFFQLGGNSLQSIRVIARCRDIGCKLTPEQFLRNPTVEALVASLNFENYDRPSNMLELEILRIWEEHLHQKLIGTVDPFETLESSQEVWKKILESLQSAYAGLPELNTTMTIREVASRIEIAGLNQVISQKIRRVIPVKTSGTQEPVFCIHSEFHYETVYSQLTRHLPHKYPIYGILSVSPELVAEYKPKSIEEIASLCIEEIKIIQPSGPYKVLSFSIGNVIAFEIARQLINSGEKVYFSMIDPPLFFHESRSFRKGNYRKFSKYLKYLNNPAELFTKISDKLKTNKEQVDLVEGTGLLEKYILDYQIEKIDCDALIIKTPSEYLKTYDWDPYVNVVDKVFMDAPHMKLMREPYTEHINEAVSRNLEKWEQEIEALKE